MIAAMSTKSMEKNVARNGLSPAPVFPAGSVGMSPSQIFTRFPTLVADAFAENAQGLRRITTSRPKIGVNADLLDGLLRGGAIDPELGHPVPIVADADENAEGDKDKAQKKADDEAGRQQVVQEFLAGDEENHGRVSLAGRLCSGTCV